MQQISTACGRFETSVLELTPGQIRVEKPAPGSLPQFFECLSEANFRYREQFGLTRRLHIIGGGHCGLALSKVMRTLDFFICLYDDRADLEAFVKNKFVHRKQVLDNYESIGALITGGPGEYVVVMTLGYRSDETVIRALLPRKFEYFGVLGSKAKMAFLFDRLSKEGIPASWLERIQTPAGLPINSRTPEEIAISIAAEIIRVKNMQ